MEKRQHKARLRIIEADKARALAITDQLDRTVVLNGSALDPAILQEANVEQADLIVTLTNQDQVNVLSAIMAKMFGCKSNMVLINNIAFQEFTRTVGIDSHLNPRSVTISKVLQQMRRGRIRSVYSVSNGEAEIIEAEAMHTSPLVGKPLSELELPAGLRIGAIYRDNSIIRPRGDTRVLAGDMVVIFAMADAVRDVEQLFRVSLEYF